METRNELPFVKDAMTQAKSSRLTKTVVTKHNSPANWTTLISKLMPGEKQYF